MLAHVPRDGVDREDHRKDGGNPDGLLRPNGPTEI